VVNVVMNLQFPYNAGNVAYFLPGRVEDLSAPLRNRQKSKKDISTFLYKFHILSSCLYRASIAFRHFIIQLMHQYIIRRYN